MRRVLAVTVALAVVGLLVGVLLVGGDGTGRNGYMLAADANSAFGLRNNPLSTRGYDWWWHAFTGRNRATGELRPFFIAYFVINPGNGAAAPVLGQDPANKAAGVRPSYALVKAGSWGDSSSVEINNYYGIADLHADTTALDVWIGPNHASETELTGSVHLTSAEAAAHPEYMSDPGEMQWQLAVEKSLSYSVGYGASDLFRSLNAFQMYWHVQGMRASYRGTVLHNGQIYDVSPETSYGYQDKNWGSGYTNPWIWLQCNKFRSETTGQAVPTTSLVVGGGTPVAFGLPLGERVLVAFHHDGVLYEWNFTKELQSQSIEVTETGPALRWRIAAEDLFNRIEIDFSAPKSHAQLIDYEDPDGNRPHPRLWNTGWAAGTVTLYDRSFLGWERRDRFEGSLGGGEYGVH